MRKSSIFGAGLLILLVAALLWRDFAATDPVQQKFYSNFGHWLDQNVFADPELAQRRQAWDRFVVIADATEAAVFTGQLSLEEAVDRIHDACQEHFPDFTRYLASVEPGASAAERIAHRIVRHFEEDAQLNLDEATRRRLHSQLADLVKKRHRGATPAGSDVTV